MPNPVTGPDDPLLSTGEVARLLGVSRQHVVDLCERGALPWITAGTHRRIRRSEALTFQRYGGPGGLTRDELRSLWLHRAVAGKLVANPERILALAHRNLARLREVHVRGKVRDILAEWARLVDGPIETVAEALTAKSRWSVELRQSSPFAGALTDRERAAVLRSFASR